MNYEKLEKQLVSKEVEYNLAKKKKIKLKKELKILKKELIILEKSISFCVEVSKESQKQNKEYIEQVVTSALQTIFDNNYGFVVDIVKKRDQQEIYFYINKYGNLLSPRQAQVSGGELNTICLGLRPAIWSLDPDNTPIMLIDEPLKDLSIDKIPIGGKIINQLSETYNLQFIIITHINELTQYGHNIIKIE